MDVSTHYALIVSGIIFGFVALMHLLRLIYKIPVRIANKSIPIWVSGIGFLLPLLLSIWVLNASSAPVNLSLINKAAFTLQSAAFKNESSIPSRYTCKGDNISPPLIWQNEPLNTKSFILVVDDPDAPSGDWDHWILFNISGTTHELVENQTSLPAGAQYGKNSFGNSAYGGPCPPLGQHRYYFKLYALDTLLNLSAGSSKLQIERAMQGHILATTTLMGLYP